MDKVFKSGIVIVTYNPKNDDDINNKISHYKQVCDLVVVVDNNSTNGFTINDDDKVSVIRNAINVGHAKALNLGCMLLLSKGFSHALLLGQDSIITNENIAKLFLYAKSNSCGIVGPQITNQEKTLVPTYLFRTKHWFKKGTIGEDEAKEVYINITSGSVVDLLAWQKVGGFWDNLFIEKVDDEFALRLRKYKYKVCVVGSIFLSEPYGESKIVKKMGITFHPTFHNSKRLYLLYRNKMYLKKRYFFRDFPYVVFQDLSLFKRFLTVLFVENKKFSKIWNMFKGTICGLFTHCKRTNKPYECDPFEFVSKK